VADGDEVQVGGARLRAVFAPGHTHHHTAYLAIDEGGQTAAAFTGGSIIIGGAGRTDLLGPAETETLTRLQWETAQRLVAELTEQAELLPTHGAGSFCSSQPGVSERRAPLAEELVRNFLFTSPDFETFRLVHLANPGPIPAYYQHMAPINRRGAVVYGAPPIPAALSLEAFERERDAGTPVIDVRSRYAFASAHVPGSISVEEGTATLAYISWVTAFNSALLLVTQDAPQAERMTVDLFSIGYEQVRGFLPGHVWLDARPTESMAIADRDEARELYASGKAVYDVRFDSDRRLLSLPGALARPIDRAQEWLPDAHHDEPLVVCAGGSRAATAGSLMLAHGQHPIVMIRGGADQIVEAVGVGSR
jgi:hydroxyacylglutathione hydrolase